MNEKLRKARNDRHWSIERAAEKIGVSRTTYLRWEHGEQFPHGYSITQACDAFNMSAERLGFVNVESGNDVDRRDFLHQTGHMAFGLMGAEALDRFYKALKKPSTTEDAVLHWLSRRSEGYWQDRNDALIPSHDLVSYVLSDFSKVTTLLEDTLSPSLRASLCSIAGELAMLVGELYFDMKSYAQSRRFYTAAIHAACEANNSQLQAVACGRMSFSWSYDD